MGLGTSKENEKILVAFLIHSEFDTLVNVNNVEDKSSLHLLIYQTINRS